MINRGTTPYLIFEFPETIDNYDDGIISFAQKNEIVIEKALDDLKQIDGELTQYSLRLSEEDVNSFTAGIFECQIRLSKNNDVYASNIYRGRISDVLNDEPIGE